MAAAFSIIEEEWIRSWCPVGRRRLWWKITLRTILRRLLSDHNINICSMVYNTVRRRAWYPQRHRLLRNRTLPQARSWSMEVLRIRRLIASAPRSWTSSQKNISTFNTLRWKTLRKCCSITRLLSSKSNYATRSFLQSVRQTALRTISGYRPTSSSRLATISGLIWIWHHPRSARPPRVWRAKATTRDWSSR